MSELGIEHIYNVPYQPDYNPTESCFSKVKNYYKRQKLNLLVNERDIDYKSLIDRSINELTKSDIDSSVKLSLHLINKWAAIPDGSSYLGADLPWYSRTINQI